MNNGKKIVFLCCMILCFCGCTNYKNHTEVSDVIIHYTYDNHGLITIPLENGKSFIIDTGSEASLIFSDRLKVKATDIRMFFFVTVKRFSLINSERSFPLKRVDSLQIGNLLIKNHDFVLGKADSTFFGRDTTIVGLIGMDILSKKYSYFDIENQTVTFSDEKKIQTETPSLVFSYKSSKRPLTDVCINETMFEDVLFDTGFNCFSMLSETDREKFNNQTSLRQDTSNDFFGNQFLTYNQLFDTVFINGVNFPNQEISYGQKYRLLGMNFVKYWSSFSTDPFKKEIEFYLKYVKENNS